jgi:hypothetical protein
MEKSPTFWLVDVESTVLERPSTLFEPLECIADGLGKTSHILIRRERPAVTLSRVERACQA